MHHVRAGKMDCYFVNIINTQVCSPLDTEFRFNDVCPPSAPNPYCSSRQNCERHNCTFHTKTHRDWCEVHSRWQAIAYCSGTSHKHSLYRIVRLCVCAAPATGNHREYIVLNFCRVFGRTSWSECACLGN